MGRDGESKILFPAEHPHAGHQPAHKAFPAVVGAAEDHCLHGGDADDGLHRVERRVRPAQCDGIG